jgi:uncharacterized protein (TIGR02996 family)
MPDREAFIAAIAANPADDLPRLVFADWLDEHGEPARAGFIRDQIALTKLRPGSEEYKALFRRTADTLRANLPGWIQSACDAFGQNSDWKPAKHDKPGLAIQFDQRQRAALVRIEFERGFAVAAQLDLSRTSDAGAVALLFRNHPISRLNLSLPHPLPEAVSRVLPDNPLPVRALRLHGAMTEGTLDVALAAKAFSGVVRLQIPATLVAERLVRSPMARRLTTLRVVPHLALITVLHEFPLDDRLQEFVILPAQYPHPAMPELWSALSRVAFRPTLKRLDLTRCGMSDDGLAAFARGEEWIRLQGLKLGGNLFGDRGWADFARGWRTPELTYLDASRNRLTDAAAVALARSGMVQTLRTIDLRGCRISGRGAMALVNAVRGGPLVRLLLAGNPLRPKDSAAVRKALGERTDI